mmetsp:Transcript_10163/g.23196  ORF Transcript_10163/g.23196 Transcript_10163/m.23196 type:complete len:109 (-) Transcript_10163:68-394(-)
MEYQIKFLFADASTMEKTFNSNITVAEAKTQLIEAWPAEKDKISSINELKMIYNGKLLENSKTFEELKVPMNQQVIMHLQPKPPVAKMHQPVVTPTKPTEQTRCCIIL